MYHAKWLPKGLSTIKEELAPSPAFPCMGTDSDNACVHPEDLALTPEPPGIVDYETDPFNDFEEYPPSPDYFIRDDCDDGLDDDSDNESAGEDEPEAEEPDYTHINSSDNTDDGNDDSFDSEAELLSGESLSSEYSPISQVSTSSDVKVLVTLETPGNNGSFTGQYHKGPLESLSTVTTALEQAGQQALSKRKRRDSFPDEPTTPRKLPRIDTANATLCFENITPVGHPSNFVEVLAECIDHNGTWYKVQWRETWLHERQMPAITPIRQDHVIRNGGCWQVVPPRANMM